MDDDATYRQRYETLKAEHDAGREAVYVALGVKNHKDALLAVRGLQERVRYTQSFESLQMLLRLKDAVHGR